MCYSTKDMARKEAGLQNVGRNGVTGDEAVKIKWAHVVREIEWQFGLVIENMLWEKTSVRNSALPLNPFVENQILNLFMSLFPHLYKKNWLYCPFRSC